MHTRVRRDVVAWRLRDWRKDAAQPRAEREQGCARVGLKRARRGGMDHFYFEAWRERTIQTTLIELL